MVTVIIIKSRSRHVVLVVDQWKWVVYFPSSRLVGVVIVVQNKAFPDQGVVINYILSTGRLYGYILKVM